MTFEDLSAIEYDRAVRKYPPEMWEKMTRFGALLALLEEVWEVIWAIIRKDYTSEHSVSVELIQVSGICRRWWEKENSDYLNK